MVPRLLVILFAVAAFGGHTDAAELLTKDRIVRSVVHEETGQVAELRWGLTAFIHDTTELFVAVHGGERECSAGIYMKERERFRLREQIMTDGRLSCFGEPRVVRHQGVYLIQITELFHGTGGAVAEHIFAIDSEGRLIPVDFTPAPESFAPCLKPGEGIWKGEMNTFTDDMLSFQFHVWNAGDANCCPRGGTVVGSYRLISPEGSGPGEGYRIRMDRFERLPAPR